MKLSMLDWLIGISFGIVVSTLLYVYAHPPQTVSCIGLFAGLVTLFFVRMLNSSPADDPDYPLEVASLADHFEATALIGHLEKHGIRAHVSGAFIAGFLVEAPGDVKVVVARRDFEQANQLISELKLDENEVDWSDVNVGRRE